MFKKLIARLVAGTGAPTCSAVIVAAGSARRMEGVDKIVSPLDGVPLIVHTLRAFQACDAVSEIVVVTREDLLVEIGKLCKDFSLYKVSKILVGGAERIHSVRAGLRETRRDAELIAIHDGARPFLSQQVLRDTIAAAGRTGAAAPAVEVTDTIKRVRDGAAEGTVDRASLRAVQTPQVFQADLIRAAIEKAITDGAAVTDDCAAVERLGMPVTLTEGDRRNIKITTPLDLTLGEAILHEGRQP